MLLFILSIIIGCIMFIIALVSLCTRKYIKPGKRIQRIIEFRKNNGAKIYRIQQRHWLYRTWHNCIYINSDGEDVVLKYNSLHIAKEKLQKYIDEYQKEKEENFGNKISDKSVILITKTIKF